MNWFISDAWAQAQPGTGDLFQALLFPILLLVIFYFLLIRPQQKRAKEHKQMLDGLQKGDEIVTAGGILGRIMDIGDNFILVEIADGLQVRVQKPMVAALMPKGTLKGDL